MRISCLCVLLPTFALFCAARLFAGELQNAAQTSLGATATFSGAPNNKGWPANGAIPREDPKARGARGGCLFGAPMKDGTIHIRLLTPCSIERVDLMQLDYHGTMCVKTVELSVDGKVVKTATLEELPQKYQEIPLSAKGQVVSVRCVDTYPVRSLKGGKTGPNYGGWARVRVMVRDDVAALMTPPGTYRTTLRPSALQPTGTAAATGTKVYGKPRVSKGHPRTTWDKEDVAEYRALLKTNAEFRRQAEALKVALDKRLTQPTGVPEPEKGDDGKWTHLGERAAKAHNNLAILVADLGTAYQLFGDEKYAAYAKRVLLDYAERFPKYGVGARPGFQHDPSILFDQRLGDATALILFATGYDFVREAKCFSRDDLKKIDEDFILADARFIRANRAHLIGATNWSAIGTAACLAAGVACDNEDMVYTALWGHRWSSLPEAKRNAANFNKWWEGDFCDKPNGIELHFSGKAIDVDGMWCEGAMGYQFMALQALVFDAEVLWHHCIDLYSYRNCALKGIFDSPILFAYPNLISPAIHDSGNANIVGREAHLYEAGWRRYRDPAYLPILKRVSRRLAAAFQQFSTSVAWDIDFDGATVAGHPSANLNGVGYGVLRVTDGRGTRNLLLDYGPNRSHGHPDKLNLDLWAFGDLQLPDPGTAWYETPIYRNWFRTTFAHNTLSVDMQEQNACGAELLTYAAGDAFGLMRARTADAYPGVTMDRAVFLTRDYVADLFGAFSRMPRTYDLAWHPCGSGGRPVLGVGDEPFTLPEPRSPGYSELKDLRCYTVPNTKSGSLPLVFENKGLRTALHAVACDAKTTLVTGSVQTGPTAPVRRAVFERRVASETVYGNVFDLSGKPDNLTKVWQVGSVADGYTQLLIRKADGSSDRCFVTTRDGAFDRKDAQVASDAQMGFSSLGSDCKTVLVMSLAGGTYFRQGADRLTLSATGGAIIERTETGSYLVRNASSVDNKVTFDSPEVKVSYALKAGETREYLPKGATPISAHRAAVLKRLADEAAAAEAKRQAERAARIKTRQALAAKAPGARGTRVVVQAEDFVAQAGGEVRLNTTKKAIVGSCFSHWDAEGQSLDWKVSVPADGYYNVSLVYCSDTLRHRAMSVNGTPVEDAELADIPSSGGFSNGADNWRVFTFAESDGSGALPIFFHAGENVLCLTNVGGGGVNLDYLIVTSPDVKPERIN